MHTRLEVRSHPDCLLHEPGLGHPDTAGRLVSVLDALEHPADSRWIVRREVPLPSEDDVVGVLKWIHSAAHLEKVRAAVEAAPGWVDSPDCGVSRGSWRAAIAAAGVSLGAALDLVNQRVDKAFLAIRPPAHHASRDRASGYCLFNHVGLAAEVIVRSWHAPVLIVDIDALHGDGLQGLFYDRPDVGYVSVHRYPAFPGTGGGNEEGEGSGEGLTLNVPLAAGAGDDIFVRAVVETVDRMVRRIPGVAAMVIAAGFSAHVADPIGGMAVTTEGFQDLSRGLAEIAQRACNGRVLSFLEGGFEPISLAESVRVHVQELSQSPRVEGSDDEPVN
jgi:acetoin utilization deacetylase AcuC-like enzyme